MKRVYDVMVDEGSGSAGRGENVFGLDEIDSCSVDVRSSYGRYEGVL